MSALSEVSRVCVTVRKRSSAANRATLCGVADQAFPPVLTAAMAAELLQVHVEYLRKLVRDGVVPAHRFPGGRELRFLRDELLAWLAALPGPADRPAAGPRAAHSDGGRSHASAPIGT